MFEACGVGNLARGPAAMPPPAAARSLWGGQSCSRTRRNADASRCSKLVGWAILPADPPQRRRQPLLEACGVGNLARGPAAAPPPAAVRSLWGGQSCPRTRRSAAASRCSKLVGWAILPADPPQRRRQPLLEACGVGNLARGPAFQRVQPPGKAAAATAFRLSAPRHNQRNIVVLLPRAEPAHLVHDSIHHCLRRLLPVLPQRRRQPLLEACGVGNLARGPAFQRVQPPGKAAAATALRLSAPRHNQRNIVVLLPRAEPAHLVHDSIHHCLRRLLPVLPQRRRQPLLEACGVGNLARGPAFQRVQPPGKAAAATAFRLSAPRHNQRNIVVLLPRAEPAHLVHDSIHHCLRRLLPVLPQRRRQPLLAELLVRVVEGFRHSVRI